MEGGMSGPDPPQRLCCFQAIWPPEPVDHTVTAVEAFSSPVMVFTGAAEGGIIKWSAAEGSHGPASVSAGSVGLWPSSFLSGHSAAVVVLQKFMAAPTRDSRKLRGRELLSGDRDGWICAWAVDSGECVRRRQLPPSCSCLGGSAAILVRPLTLIGPLGMQGERDGRHVALVCESFAPGGDAPSSRTDSMKGWGQNRLPQPVEAPGAGSQAGLVIVDAWTLATTRRLSPTFTRPRSLSLLGYGSGHGMSEPCLDGLVAGAALLDGGDVGLLRRTQMTTLKVFNTVPAALAEEAGRVHSDVDDVLAQQYIVDGWDAAWGGMSDQEINQLNQEENGGSLGLLRQSLGMSCMVLGISRDGSVFAWQVEDTIIASTQSLEAMSPTAANPSSSSALLQWLAWSEGAMGSNSFRPSDTDDPVVHALPQDLASSSSGSAPSEPSTPLKSSSCHDSAAGSIQGSAFSVDGLQLLVVRRQGWQLLESLVPWCAGEDFPTYAKVVSSGGSPFHQRQERDSSGQASELAGGIVLRVSSPTYKGSCPTAASTSCELVQRPSAEGQRTQPAGRWSKHTEGRQSIESLDLRISPFHGKEVDGGGVKIIDRADSLLQNLASARRAKADLSNNNCHLLLLWNGEGAGALLQVGEDTTVLEAAFPGEEIPQGAQVTAICFRQLGGGLLLRAVTLQHRCSSPLGATYTRQDTHVALFHLPACFSDLSLEGVSTAGSNMALDRNCWLSAAWGSIGCGITNAAAGLGECHREPLTPAATPTKTSEVPLVLHEKVGLAERGSVTAVQLLGGDNLAPDTIVHGHASGLISVFPLSAAMLPAPPLHDPLATTAATAVAASFPVSDGGNDDNLAAKRLQPMRMQLRSFDGSLSGADRLDTGASLLSSVRPKAVLRGHLGRVLCFLEVHHWPQPHDSPEMGQEGRPKAQRHRSLLLSGGDDGSVRGWPLVGGYPETSGRGGEAFAVHAHTAAVKQLLPPPPGSPAPWDKCIATVGADGTVCIISLQTLRIERVLPGHPPGSPIRVLWDPTRGFMACLCRCSISEAAAQQQFSSPFPCSTDWDAEPAAANSSGSPTGKKMPLSSFGQIPERNTSVGSVKQKIQAGIKQGSAQLKKGASMLYARHSLISLEPHGTALPTKDTGSKEPISSHGGHELEQEKLLVVWDLSTSRRDRVLSGIAADSLMQHFEATVGHRHQAAAVPGPAEEALSKGAHWAGEESSSALAMMGVSMLSIDADRLLVHSNQMTNASLQGNAISATSPSQQSGGSHAPPIHSPQSGGGPPVAPSFSFAAGGAGLDPQTCYQHKPGEELAALTLALGLLHCWGLDSWTDSKMLRMLAASTSEALQPPSAGALGNRGQNDGLALFGVLLARGAMPGFAGAMTLQLPLPLNVLKEDGDDTLAAAKMKPNSGAHDTSTDKCKEPREESSTCTSGVPRHWWGDLWLYNTEFVKQRLLIVTAMANRVMKLGSESEVMCNGASALITLYALQLQDTSLPLALPSLSSYAVLWQTQNMYLRDAARSLLNAATGQAVRSGSGSSPRLTAATAVSPSRRQREFKLSPEMEEVVELRAAFAARMPAAEAVQRSAVSIIVCGATCLSHWDQVPDRLFQATAPLLSELACLAPAPHSAAAASLLSEGFLSVGAQRWKAAMGSQLPHFIGRVFDMCEQLSHEPKPAKAHHEHIDDLQASADPGATAPTSPTGVGGVKHRIKMAFRPAGEDRPEEPSAGDLSTRLACRASLESVIPSIAAADLQLFLHALGARFGGAVREDSPTHMMALISLVRLVHKRPVLVGIHLPLLVSVICRSLDPVHPTLRRSCAQGVSAVVQEICMRFPMACQHNSAASGVVLAVGTALPGIIWDTDRATGTAASRGRGRRAGRHSGGAAKRLSALFGVSDEQPLRPEGAEEVVAVYDMTTGYKKRILALPAGSTVPSPGISAVAFDGEGTAILTFSASDGCVRLWSLAAQWTQRLTANGPLILSTHRQQQLLNPKQLPPPVTASGQVELGYSLAWQGNGNFTLSHGSNALAHFHMDTLTKHT